MRAVKGDGLLGDGGEGWLHSGSRRRRWSAARKAVIVAESLVAGAKVSEVAARHGVNANMLSAWRGQVSAGGMTRSRPKSAPISSAVTFAPVKVVAAGPQSDARADLRPAALRPEEHHRLQDGVVGACRTLEFRRGLRL